MAKTGAYTCDGPTCTEMTALPSGARTPKRWGRMTLIRPVTGDTVSGFFHHADCMHAFIDEQMHDSTQEQEN